MRPCGALRAVVVVGIVVVVVVNGAVYEWFVATIELSHCYGLELITDGNIISKVRCANSKQSFEYPI